MSAKKTRSNKKQLNVLVDFMSTHNHLATGEFTGPLGAKRAESEWQILRDILKEYGPDRAVEQWKQTWKDLKKGARIENAAAASGRSTMGNVATVPTVSEMGTKVLNIIGHESSTGIGPEESSISQANKIIEVSVVEHDTHSKLFEHSTAPSSFADELENIPPAPSNSLLAPSTSHSAPSTSHSAPSTSHPVPFTPHSAHSTRYATAQNKKEWSHDDRLQQENNACLQSIDERLKKQNSLLCEQNQLLRAQNAHLGHRNKLERMKRLIIGAPKAASRDNRNISPGLVFNCQLENLDVRNSTCQPIGLNIDGYGSFFANVLMPKNFFRDDMWFGATIASVPDGKLLICAPRWTVPYRDKHLLANGACYLISQKRGMTLLPLKEMNHQAFKTDGSRKEYGEYGTHLNFYAYAQAGMSIKVTESNSVIMGAPGLLQWTGGIVDYQFLSDTRSMFFSKQPTTNPYYTKELGPDDYFGYSVESGVFGVDNKTLYLAGAPRSELGYGQVLIFEPALREHDPLKVVLSLRGPQLGSYFGASLCCIDVNRDGYLDLLVGAPNYVTKEGELRYDQGAVFIYLNERLGNNFALRFAGFVSGSNLNGARFGSAIADLNDVDGDGYRDVAIGAPWENEGRGAVYLYRGGEKGLHNHYAQKIVAENALSFGMSISKGFDVDSNNCSDLAIGAINSGTAYLYRCVPTMEVHAAIKVPDAMYLPLNATNFTALFCVGAPEQLKWPHVKISLQAKITVDPNGGRAWTSGDAEYQVSIKPGSNACEEQIVKVMPTADLSKPITLIFDLEPKMLLEDGSANFLHNEARLSESSRLHSSFDIQLNRDCGDDLICKPLLEIDLKALTSPYVPGSESRLGVQVTVLNKDEPAYGAKVYLTLPSSPKRLPSACSLEELNVTCEVPAPLHRNESVSWEIELELAEKTSVPHKLIIKANLEDPLHKKNDSDRITKELAIIIKPEAIFNVSGTALPNRTITITRDELSSSGNIAFVHYFEITSLGPSDWFNLPAQIIIPDRVSLSNTVDGCSKAIGGLQCSWSLHARSSQTISLSFKFNLSLHGDYLEANTTLNATSAIILLLENQNSRNATVTTTLVLDPAPPIWPLIVGIVAGLLVLATIVYVLYKYGFFTRKKREDLKRLQEQSDDSNSLADLTLDDNDMCTQDKLFEDSD